MFSGNWGLYIILRRIHLLTLAPNGVGLFTVGGLVSDSHVLLRHSERDNVLEEDADKASNDDVEEGDEDDSEELDAKLAEAEFDLFCIEAIEKADVFVVVSVEDVVEVWLGEDAA